MSKVRLGCVPYLNARPLIAFFETEEGRDLAEVVYAVPSRFSQMLERGELDVALASSFFSIENPGFAYAPGVSIASRGAVESVRIFSKVPLAEIRSLALDSSSMTSIHLARIILAERYGAEPECVLIDPDLDTMLSRHDAAVLIGNAGLGADVQGLKTLDLGAAWSDWIGLPFVWAMWLGAEPLTDDVVDLLVRAKSYGSERIASIAAHESRQLGLSEGRCLRYLAEVIDYELGAEHLAGFKRFGELCKSHGFVRDTVSP